MNRLIEFGQDLTNELQVAWNLAALLCSVLLHNGLTLCNHSFALSPFSNLSEFPIWNPELRGGAALIRAVPRAKNLIPSCSSTGREWEKVQETSTGEERGCSSGNQMKVGASSQASVMAGKTSEF